MKVPELAELVGSLASNASRYDEGVAMSQNIAWPGDSSFVGWGVLLMKLKCRGGV